MGSLCIHRNIPRHNLVNGSKQLSVIPIHPSSHLTKPGGQLLRLGDPNTTTNIPPPFQGRRPGTTPTSNGLWTFLHDSRDVGNHREQEHPQQQPLRQPSCVTWPVGVRVDVIPDFRRSRQCMVRRQAIRRWNEGQGSLEIPQAVRLHPISSVHLNITLWGMVPLGPEKQLLLNPRYCIHALPPHSPGRDPLPHPAIQNEILLNRMTLGSFLSPPYGDLSSLISWTFHSVPLPLVNIIEHVTRNGELRRV